MRNVQAVQLIHALGGRIRNPLPAEARTVVDDWLAPTSGAGRSRRKPSGAAAAAAQDAWESM